MPWKTEWTSLKFPSQTFVVKDKIEVISNHFHSSYENISYERTSRMFGLNAMRNLNQKSPPFSRLHHYLDHFNANLLYFILKMSILKGVQAWPQQSLSSSSLERYFTCATPCLRRWCVSYSPRLIKGIYGAKKSFTTSSFCNFQVWWLEEGSLYLCVAIYNIWSRLHPFCL